MKSSTESRHYESVNCQQAKYIAAKGLQKKEEYYWRSQEKLKDYGNIYIADNQDNGK